MFGYILNFYKHTTVPSDLKMGVKEYLEEASKEQKEAGEKVSSLLVYGEFDRMDIERIEDFSRFRDVDPYAKAWDGPRQTMLLYTLEDEFDSAGDILSKIAITSFKSGNRQEYSLFEDGKSFLIFTMLTLDPSQYETDNFEKSLVNCKNEIEALIASKPRNFDYQILGSFSSSELVIVWKAKQYTEVLNVAEQLRNISYKRKNKDGEKEVLCFASVYSIVAQIKVKREYEESLSVEEEAAYGTIEGDAVLLLAFQDGVKDERIRRNAIEEIKKELADTVARIRGNSEQLAASIEEKSAVGEYDVMLRMPADYLCNPLHNPFRKGGVLHWMKERNLYNFSKSCIQLYYDSDKADNVQVRPEREVPQSKHLNSLINDMELIKQVIYGKKNNSGELKRGNMDLITVYRKKGLRSIVKQYIPETVGLCDTLDLLYSDYINNCSNLTSKTWASDLSDQFLEMMDYIFNQLFAFCDENTPENSMEMYRQIRDISSAFIQMIYHIAQSRRIIFIVPSCHLRYMGQYDMILRAYYGLEKYLLKIGYRMERNDHQPLLTPIFTIDVAPEIYTRIFKIPYHYREQQMLSGVFRINLPLGSMVDFLRYSMTITHETAHFLTPCNRNKRNQVIGMLFFADKISACIRYLPSVVSVELSDVDSDNRFYRELQKEVMCCIYNSPDARKFYMENLHPEKEGENHDERYYTWREYRKELIIKMGECGKIDALKGIVFSQEKTILKAINYALKKVQTPSDDSIIKKNHEIMTKIQQEFRSDIQEYFCISYYEISKLEISDLIAAAYREACQDLFCIRIFKLQLVDYLVYCVRHLHDTLDDIKDIPKSEQIRISMICDYMLLTGIQESGGDFSAELHSKNQFSLVRMLDMSYSEYDRMLKNGLLSERFWEKIPGFWGSIRKEYAWYIEDYFQFRSLIFYQLKDSDIGEKSLQDDYCLAPFYQTWKNALLNRNISGIFQNNISMIHYFQKQEKLREINLVTKKADGDFDLIQFHHGLQPQLEQETNAANKLLVNYVIQVSDSSALRKEILHIFARYDKYKKYGIDSEMLWYRGHENADYFLYPTIYRFYVDHNSKATRRTLVQYQHAMINYYLSVARNYKEAPELYPGKIGNQQIEYLADMQHYQFKTNLVDWSDDIGTALFFAVSENEHQDQIENAALYVFHPILYNLLRREIIEYFQEKSRKGPIDIGKIGTFRMKNSEKCDSIKRLRKSAEWYESGVLPSMSPQFNQDDSCFQDYIFGPSHSEWTTECRSNPFEKGKSRKDPPMLPVAISLPKNNTRISAQSGKMLAFNLCEQPVMNHGKIEERYPHAELMEIQSFYQNDEDFEKFLEARSKSEEWKEGFPLLEKTPFIYKLVLRKNSYRELRNLVKILNKTRNSIYPSLENAGKDSEQIIAELLGSS